MTQNKLSDISCFMEINLEKFFNNFYKQIFQYDKNNNSIALINFIIEFILIDIKL